MGKRPKAPCPFCNNRNADNQVQELFALHGPGESEHDPGIPEAYFEIAPAKLSEPDMEALRVSRKPSSSICSRANTTIVPVRVNATIRV